jgi:TolB-like protein
MRARLSLAVVVIGFMVGPARAEGEAPAKSERIGIAVTEFVSKGGVEQNRMDALSDMMSNQIREMGNFKVIGKADISAALQLEQQKALLGCTDDSCLAEMGGALGVRYMVVGNISLLGKTWLLNLKLLDVRTVEVVKGVSRSITGAEDHFIKALQEAVYDLMLGIEGVEVSRPDEIKEVTGDTMRTESGWFVPPGGRKGDFHLALGLGVAVAPPAFLKGNVVDSNVYFTELEKVYSAAWLNIFVGYNLVSWLTLAIRAGGTLGKAGGRQRNAFEGALELQGSMMPDSWFQPVAYFDIGLVYLRDESDDEATVQGQRIEALGIVNNLGLGFNIWVSPNWFIGARLGGMVRILVGLSSNETDTTVRRISGARAYEIGVNAALMTGYEF